MRDDIRATISKAWPSMVADDAPGQPFMTISTDEIYRQYGQSHDPRELFEKAAHWVTTIQTTTLSEEQQEIVFQEVHESMLRAIFGSNRIERAGLGWDITVQLCRRIFSGEDVRPIDERDKDYQNHLLEIYHKQPDLKGSGLKFIFRGRNEIVQHAKAFQHLIHAFVAQKQDLSEALIKETHSILVTGVPIIQQDGHEIPPEQYGGMYRTVPVCAGNTNFTVPKFVPRQMAQMCKNLQEELLSARDKKSIDPFSLAAKYSMEFVQIHPFRDGNGRMCRIILNAILCRYAGIIVPIGEHDEERDEYLGIKRRASQEMEGHGEYASYVLKRSLTRLRALKKKMAGKASMAKAETR